MTSIDFTNKSDYSCKRLQDRRFIPRVKEYVENCIHKPSIEEIMDHLQVSFPEYSRRKRQALREYVTKALNQLNSSNSRRHDRTSDIEQKFAKRQKRSKSIDKDEDDESSDESESMECDEEMINYKDSNIINNAIKNMYRNVESNKASRVIDLTLETFSDSSSNSEIFSQHENQEDVKLFSAKHSAVSVGKVNPHSPLNKDIRNGKDMQPISKANEPLSPRQQDPQIFSQNNNVQELSPKNTRSIHSSLSQELSSNPNKRPSVSYCKNLDPQSIEIGDEDKVTKTLALHPSSDNISDTTSLVNKSHTSLLKTASHLSESQEKKEKNVSMNIQRKKIPLSEELKTSSVVGKSSTLEATTQEAVLYPQNEPQNTPQSSTSVKDLSSQIKFEIIPIVGKAIMSEEEYRACSLSSTCASSLRADGDEILQTPESMDLTIISPQVGLSSIASSATESLSTNLEVKVSLEPTISSSSILLKESRTLQSPVRTDLKCVSSEEQTKNTSANIHASSHSKENISTIQLDENKILQPQISADSAICLQAQVDTSSVAENIITTKLESKMSVLSPSSTIFTHCEENKILQSPVSKDLISSQKEPILSGVEPTAKDNSGNIIPLVNKNLGLKSDDEKSGSSRPSSPVNGKKSKSSRTLASRSKRKTLRKDEEPLKEKKRFEPTISKTTFKDVGGYESCLQEVSRLLLHLKHPEVFSQIGIKVPRGFLLHGPPGCGKTLLANAIAGELNIPFFSIAATEIVSGISGDSEERIRLLFSEALSLAPSIIFIDEIDSIAQKRENAGKEMERRIVTQILSCMDDLDKSDLHVLVIGASNRPDSLDPSLRRAGRFDREIAMGIPDRASRKAILQVICKDLRLSPDFDFERIAVKTPGFVGVDIQALTREAGICAMESVFQSLETSTSISVKKENVNEELVDTVMSTQTKSNESEKGVENLDTSRPSKTVGEASSIKESSDSTAWLRDQPPLTRDQLSALYITTEHFEKALSHVQPCAKREGFATVPDVTWDDIGALEDIRDELEMAIMAPVENPAEFESLGLTTPPGILLVGPPGCGKTLLAKAIANEAGINFISVKGPELLNMYVGESEKAVRQVFQRARNSSPCVIFFDEIDALCPKRSQTGDSNVTSRVVNQLLTEMDGLETRKQVFIMGATNRPDILDGAILRPGRIDRQLFVGLPDATDREKILNKMTKYGTKPTLSDDITIEELAFDQRLEGFSGADLGAVVREASVCALKEFRKYSKVCHTSKQFEYTDSALNMEIEIKHEDMSLSPTRLQPVIKTINNNVLSNSLDSQPAGVSSKVLIRKRHFEAALKKVKASVSGMDRRWYEKMRLKKSK